MSLLHPMVRVLVLATCVLVGLVSTSGARQLRLDEGVTADRVTFYPSHEDPDRWFYVPDHPRIAMEEGRPQFSFLKYTGDGASGGIIHLVVELGVPEKTLRKAEARLKRLRPGAKVEGPLTFGAGQLAVVTTVAEKARILGVGNAPLLSGARAAVSIPLDKNSAGILWEQFDMNAPDVALSFEMSFDGLGSPVSATVVAELDEVFKHKAFNASVAGLFYEAEIDAAMDSLVTSRVIRIEQVGEDESLTAAIEEGKAMVKSHLFEPAKLAVPKTPKQGNRAAAAFKDMRTREMAMLSNECREIDSLRSKVLSAESREQQLAQSYDDPRFRELRDRYNRAKARQDRLSKRVEHLEKQNAPAKPPAKKDSRARRGKRGGVLSQVTAATSPAAPEQGKGTGKGAKTDTKGKKAGSNTDTKARTAGSNAGTKTNKAGSNGGTKTRKAGSNTNTRTRKAGSNTDTKTRKAGSNGGTRTRKAGSNTDTKTRKVGSNTDTKTRKTATKQEKAGAGATKQPDPASSSGSEEAKKKNRALEKARSELAASTAEMQEAEHAFQQALGNTADPNGAEAKLAEARKEGADARAALAACEEARDGIPSFYAAAKLELRKVERSGLFEMSMKKWRPRSQAHRFDVNVGAQLVRYRQDERVFARRNIEDPMNELRPVNFLLTETSNEDFGRHLQFVSVEMRKTHEDGSVTRRSARIDARAFAEKGGLVEMQYGWRDDDDTDRWLQYEHRAIWHFRPGIKHATEWTSTDEADVHLTPPLELHHVSIDADPDRLAEEGVRLVTARVYFRAGSKERVEQVQLDPAKDLLSANVGVPTAGGAPEFDYEVLWTFDDGSRESTGRQRGIEQTIAADPVL